MKKKTIYLLIVIIFSFTLYNDVKAQSYEIQTFDGSKAKINLTSKLNRTLSISCLKDTIFIPEFIDIKEAHLLHEKFLQISYDTRGGSGLDLRNTIILSVNKSRINVSMLVVSYAGLISADKNGSYWLKFNMPVNNGSTYQLIVNVHDKQTSKLHPEANYNRNEQVILNFDADRNIFYSTHKDINKLFTINDSKTEQSVKQKIGEILPIIELGRNSYYYIKSEWYAYGYDDNLFKEYYGKP